MDKVYLAYNRMGRRSLRGAGDPNTVLGTPSRAGLRYLDTTTGVMYLSRNVLNFNNSAFISLPLLTGVRSVEMQFYTPDATIATSQPYFDQGVADANRINLERRGDNSNLACVNSAATLNGVAISNNSTNPPANVWNKIVINPIGGVDKQFDYICRGTNATSTRRANIRACNVIARGAGNVLLASYAINEGSGTAIIDSSGNGLNGTLTLGSGAWILDWVPVA